MQEEISGLRYLLIKSRFRRPPKEESSTWTGVSAHLSNTTAKRRCKATFGPAQNSHRGNDTDILNSSAYRERRKAKVSSMEEV